MDRARIGGSDRYGNEESGENGNFPHQEYDGSAENPLMDFSLAVAEKPACSPICCHKVNLLL